MKLRWRLDLNGSDVPGGNVWGSGDTPEEARADLEAELLRRRDAAERDEQAASESLSHVREALRPSL